MKKIRLVIIAIYGIASGVIPAQEYAQSWEFGSQMSGNKHYTARDDIYLKPGFSYKASSGNSFLGQIDPTLLFPPTGNTYARPDGTIVGTYSEGGVVGSIPGEIVINTLGAATYTVPIECPKGINGMEPQVSLIYNSQGGNGLLGWGWHIGGISSISRTGSTLYHDNKINNAIGLNNSDNLMVDGQRLVVSSGTHFVSGVKYRTEIESFNDITYKTINGYLGFEVITKEGLTMEYGSSSDTNFKLQGSSETLTWLLKKVTDQNGNYISFNYGTNSQSGEFWLTEILYTGNNNMSITPVNKIEFIYVSRSDSNIAYIAGKPTKQTKRLANIRVSTNSQLQRSYSFTYAYDGFYLKLTAITLNNEIGARFNPTTINWGNSGSTGIQNIKNVPLNDWWTLDPSLIFVDLNNDGYADCLRPLLSQTTGLRAGAYHYLGWELYLSQNNGQSYTLAQQVHRDTHYDIFSYVIGLQFLPGDFNQDGIMDIAEIRYDGTEYCIDFLLFENGQLVRQSLTTMTFAASIYDDFSFEFRDFNGDGELELLVLSCLSNATSSKAALYRINRASNTKTILHDLTLSSRISKFARITDVNGNGLPEIFFGTKSLAYNNSAILEFNRNSGRFEEIAFTRTFSNSRIDAFECVDLNGDGKTDIVSYNLLMREWLFLLSTGNSFVEITSPITRNRSLKTVNNNEEFTDDYYFSDYNGDGKSDIIEMYSDTINIYYCTGEQFIKKAYGKNNLSGSSFYYGKYIPYFDINGDGKCDMVVNAGNGFSVYSFDTNETNRRVQYITNGLNQKHSVSYHPISNSSYHSKGETACAYPAVKTVQPVYVATRHKLEGGGISQTKDYYYTGFKVHAKGKGVLGFDKITEINSIQNRSKITSFGYNTTYFNTYPVSQTVSNVSHATLLSTTTYEPGIKILNAAQKRIFPYIKTHTVTDNLTGISTKKEILGMDDYGNPSPIKTTKGNWAETQTVTYIQKGSWCLNKPENVTITNQLGNESQTRTKKYAYNTQGRLTEDITDVNHVNQLKIIYSDFDGFGHAKKKTATVNGKSRSETLTYTASGRFLHSRKNDQLNETVTYNYDEIKGTLTSEVSRLGTTSYQYDSFGRLKLTTYPDGIKTAHALQWAGNTTGKPTGGIYYSYAETSGNSPVITWHDALGREIRQEQYGLNNSKIWIDTEYDPGGRVYRISKPYFANTSVSWNETYTYDTYGRKSRISTPLGNTVYTYSGLTTTVSTPAGTVVTSINSAGWTASQTTYGKSVTFTHYPSGLVKTSTPQGGQALTMQYDLQGNRTRLVDPDAGIIRSKYNGFGELEWTKQKIHTSGDSITTSNTYTAAGLLESVTRNGEVTNYIYDSYNRISKIAITGKHEQTFTYDNYDRITNVQEKIGNRVYNNQTVYDALGRVWREIYPSGYYTENVYDAYSNVVVVRDNSNRQILKNETENAFGQLTQVTRGSKTTSFGYDARNYPSSMVTSGIANMTTTFLSNGNLSLRKDNLTGCEERYGYDSMNRLTSYTHYLNGTQYNTQTITYNPTTGNIAAKSDAGFTNMQYGGNSKPHALTTLTSASSLPDVTITYTDFNKVSTVAEGNKHYALTYGVDNQRRSSVYKVNNAVKTTRYYVGNYEEEVTGSSTRKLHYLPGGAVFIQNNGQDSLLYGYSDYLGSLVALTNESGTVIEKYAYDAWGKRRNPADWRQADTRTSWKLNRGYTGHEHLDMFGIINMNGRVYDPLTAQFFSPDPYVQAPGNWLNYNRYAYCLNNPFLYTDPSGEFIFTVLAAIFCPVLLPAAISTDIGWISGGVRAMNTPGMSFMDGAWRGAVTGAVGGLLAPVGGAGMSFAANMGLGAAQGATTGGLDALLWGNDIGKGMLWGAASGAAFAAATSDEFSNFTKGKGFKSNDAVLDDFRNMKYTNQQAGEIWQNDALKYFGFEGNYDSNLLDPGGYNPVTRKISYGDAGFDKNYDWLHAVAKEEYLHKIDHLIDPTLSRTDFVKNINSSVVQDNINLGEWRVNMQLYKQQGLFPNSGRDFSGFIFRYGTAAKIYDNYDYFQPSWWHSIYKIPRRF